MHQLQRRVVLGLGLGAILVLAGCEGESIPQVEGIEVESNDQSFQSDALDSPLPVLVDFGATWCGPCRQMEPALAYLSVEYEDRVRVVKVDVDESPVTSAAYSIEPIPTFVILKDGREVDRKIGSMSYRMLSSWVDEHVDSQPQAATVAEAADDPPQ